MPTFRLSSFLTSYCCSSYIRAVSFFPQVYLCFKVRYKIKVSDSSNLTQKRKKNNDENNNHQQYISNTFSVWDIREVDLLEVFQSKTVFFKFNVYHEAYHEACGHHMSRRLRRFPSHYSHSPCQKKSRKLRIFEKRTGWAVLFATPNKAVKGLGSNSLPKTSDRIANTLDQ